MRKIYLIPAFLIVSLTTMAQAGSLIWQKCYGGTGADSARSVANTTDGGYYVAGVTYSNDGNVTGNHNPTGNYSDVWVIKVDKSGSLVWEKTFGGSYQDQANSIYATNDGGAVIAGWTNSADGDVDSLHGTAGGAADFWILKIDNTGTLQWQETLGGTGNDYGQSVQQTQDGGYIVAGSTYSHDGDVAGNHDASGATADFWVVKLNSTGTIQWQKNYGGSLNDLAASVAQTNEGGYIVAGTTYSSNGDVTLSSSVPTTNAGDYWLLKLTSTGTVSWQNNYGGTYQSVATSVVQTNDNNYALAGYSFADNYNVSQNYNAGTGTTADNWIVKGNNNGAFDWGNCFGGTLNDFPNSIKQTRDGYVIITGTTNSNNALVSGNQSSPTYDFWTYELKSSLYPPAYWYSCFGGSANDAGYDVTETTDSNFVEVGTTNSNDGQVSGNHGSYDFWVIKVQSQEGAPNTHVGIESINSAVNVLSVYPNPANNYAIISVSDNLIGTWLELTDVAGRSISREQITNGKYQMQTDGLAKGVYLIKVSDNTNQETVKKLVIQ